MAGRIIRVVKKKRLILSSSNQFSADQEIFLAQRVDVSNWREMVAYCRLHAPSTISAAANWTTPPTVVFYQDGYTSEDTTFVQVKLTGTSFVNLPNNISSTSAFTVFAIPSNFGGLMAISVVARAAATANADFWLSVDLEVKE